MSDRDHFLRELNERDALLATVYDEIDVAGVNLQEASSTTLPPNSRFAFFKDDAFLNPDEVDSEVTHTPPLYEVTPTAGEHWVAGGSERNTYVPGFESAASIAFQVGGSIPSDQYLPSDYDHFAAGYLTYFDNSNVSGVPHESHEYQIDGVDLYLEPFHASLRAHKNNEVVAELDVSEWKLDPFTNDDYLWDVSNYTLLRVIFDLYGAGSATFFTRIRDVHGIADTIELGTIGVRENPLARTFNHPTIVHAGMKDAITGSPSFKVGPLHYHVKLGDTPPFREKNTPYRNINVADTIAGNTWTVVRVYRVDIDRREAGIRFTGVGVDEGATNTNVALRSVHRDYLDFTSAPNPDNDSNWRAPPGSNTRETALRELKASSGDASDEVSLSTFTDDDDVTKIRGEKEIAAHSTSGTGNRNVRQAAQGQATMSEFLYVALIAQVGNANENIDLIEVKRQERW